MPVQHSKIYLILGVALVLRLYNISSPLIGVHSWRQADTASIARNFSEGSMNLLHPQVDWGGASAGFVECEFPFYSFLVAFLYRMFGFSEILGRLLSIAFSLVGLYYYFLLIRLVIDEKTALWSSFFAAILPLNVYYGRTFMPEAAMLACSVIGVFYFSRWTALPRTIDLFLSALFICLACLLKIPALYLLIPLLYLAWQALGRRMFFEWKLWAFLTFVILPVALWYYHAHRILLDGGLSFGIWEYGADKWGNWDLVATLAFWKRIFYESLAQKHFAVGGFVAFVFGAFLPRVAKREWLFDFWLFAVIVYFVIVAQGNFIHEYYQLPFMLPGIVYVGKVFARFFRMPIWKSKESIALALCLYAVVVVGLWKYQIYMNKENPDTSDVFQLAQRIRETTEKGSRIIVWDENDPTILYLSHRKGWHLQTSALTLKNLEAKRNLGARYFAGFHGIPASSSSQSVDTVLKMYRTLFDSSKYFIVDLTATAGG